MSETASTGTESTTETVVTQSEITTVEQLPEFARNMITELRQENASTRVKKNEAVEAAKGEVQTAFEAKLAESNTAHEATKDQLAQATMSMAKLNAAIEAGVPTDKLTSFASRLQGSTAEELKADAVEVKKIFGITESTPVNKPATDPSQGLAGDGSENADSNFASFMMSKFN